MTRRSLTTGRLVRTYLLVEPTGGGAPEGCRPLVMVFHGTGQSGRRMRRFSGESFDALADAFGAVVVYPDGYRRDWNGARDINTPAQRRHVDDVGFVDALVDELAEQRDVDQERVYVVGFSLGGQMVMRLLHDRPARLAGAVVISCTQPEPSILSVGSTAPGKPVPVMFFHGTKDPLAPYDGGHVGVHGRFSRGPHLSAEATAQYYATRNGVTGPAGVSAFERCSGSGETSITVRQFGSSADSRVLLYSIEGGGHQVPNPRRVPAPWFWGPSSLDISIAEEFGRVFLRRADGPT